MKEKRERVLNNSIKLFGAKKSEGTLYSARINEATKLESQDRLTVVESTT